MIGLTKAKQAIELCSELGIAMTVEGKYIHNHPTSLREDQSVAVATTNFA